MPTLSPGFRRREFECFQRSPCPTSVPSLPQLIPFAGDLKLLDARSGACLRLMHIEECPLNSVDWSTKDPLWIGAVSGGRW